MSSTRALSGMSSHVYHPGVTDRLTEGGGRGAGRNRVGLKQNCLLVSKHEICVIVSQNVGKECVMCMCANYIF